MNASLQASISDLKNNFQKYLSEADTQLVDHLSNSNKKVEDSVNRIDASLTEKNESFTKWFENTKNEEWMKWHNSSMAKITDLENTYKEKLKLEEPAKYWSERATKLKGQGWRFLWILIGLVVVACILLGVILWKAPDTIYATWFGSDKSAAIRWSVVYITLISFIAFCIRAVNKVMFSSFHLARDCEERYTLTYFYLSLLKDSKVNDTDRQLIMQSLFSRAETGLLKDDATPAMPNDLASKYFGKQ
jgi:hypothetical protein